MEPTVKRSDDRLGILGPSDLGRCEALRATRKTATQVTHFCLIKERKTLADLHASNHWDLTHHLVARKPEDDFSRHRQFLTTAQQQEALFHRPRPTAGQ
jgi:hypothetical protein